MSRAARDLSDATRLQLEYPPPDDYYWGADIRLFGGSLKYHNLNRMQAYLETVGRILGAQGWAPAIGRGYGKTGVRRNPAGPAVGGDVWALFWAPGGDVGVELAIEPETLRNHGILWRTVTPANITRGGDRNQWALPDTPADQLAETILRAVHGTFAAPARRTPWDHAPRVYH